MSILPSEISCLSVAEKFELLEAIWEDLAAQAPSALSDEQSAELDRRIAGYEQAPDAVIPWEYVKADLFKK